MSVYYADNPVFFLQAVDSVLNQTMPPGELIVSVDGPVASDIETALSKIEKLPVAQVLRLPENQGLGSARHTAILSARHEIVAVMDADDISISDRFERQLGHLESSGADIVGGFIEEFEKTPGDLLRIREVPLTHTDITRFGKWRSPMNHVTIMFRREAYMRAGGYQAWRSIEDYDLFYRMYLTGAKFANSREVLVHVRGGASILNRRRGLLYLRQELALIQRMRQSGFLTVWQWVINSGVRIVIRSLPAPLLSPIYWLLRK